MVLAKGQAAHPELATRMDRAAQTLALCSIAPAVAPANAGIGYWVESSRHDKEYWVTLDPRGYRGDRCTCPDYVQRGGPCRHAIAVRLLQACERAEAKRQTAPSNVVAFPTRHYSDAARFELTPEGEAYCVGLTREQPPTA